MLPSIFYNKPRLTPCVPSNNLDSDGSSSSDEEQENFSTKLPSKKKKKVGCLIPLKEDSTCESDSSLSDDSECGGMWRKKHVETSDIIVPESDQSSGGSSQAASHASELSPVEFKAKSSNNIKRKSSRNSKRRITQVFTSDRYGATPTNSSKPSITKKIQPFKVINGNVNKPVSRSARRKLDVSNRIEVPSKRKKPDIPVRASKLLSAVASSTTNGGEKVMSATEVLAQAQKVLRIRNNGRQVTVKETVEPGNEVLGNPVTDKENIDSSVSNSLQNVEQDISSSPSTASYLPQDSGIVSTYLKAAKGSNMDKVLATNSQSVFLPHDSSSNSIMQPSRRNTTQTAAQQSGKEIKASTSQPTDEVQNSQSAVSCMINNDSSSRIKPIPALTSKDSGKQSSKEDSTAHLESGALLMNIPGADTCKEKHDGTNTGKITSTPNTSVVEDEEQDLFSECVSPIEKSEKTHSDDKCGKPVPSGNQGTKPNFANEKQSGKTKPTKKGISGNVVGTTYVVSPVLPHDNAPKTSQSIPVANGGASTSALLPARRTRSGKAPQHSGKEIKASTSQPTDEVQNPQSAVACMINNDSSSRIKPIPALTSKDSGKQSSKEDSTAHLESGALLINIPGADTCKEKHDGTNTGKITSTPNTSVVEDEEQDLFSEFVSPLEKSKKTHSDDKCGKPFTSGNQGTKPNFANKKQSHKTKSKKKGVTGNVEETTCVVSPVLPHDNAPKTSQSIPVANGGASTSALPPARRTRSGKAPQHSGKEIGGGLFNAPDEQPREEIKDDFLDMAEPLQDNSYSESSDDSIPGQGWREGDLQQIIFLNEPKFSTPAEEITPTDYFKQYFDDKILDCIVEETNIYTTQKTGKSLDVSKEEILAFFGILIFMGISRLPALTDYWASSTRIPQVADVMSRKRFQDIHANIHFHNNEEEGEDRLLKIRPLLNHIRKKCQNVEQECHLSVDERMQKYKGTRAGNIRQYMPDKPSSKWGFKLFVLAGASGFTYDFIPYCGSDTFSNEELPAEVSNMGVGATAVVSLCKCIRDPVNSTVTFDNYYTGIPLIQYLRDKMQLHSLGTIKRNRLLQCPLTDGKKLQARGRGSYESQVNKNAVVVVQWADNKAVCLASSYVGVEPAATIKRYCKDQRAKADVPCPQAVLQYNKSMGGVDLGDMLMALYAIPTKARRWYFPLMGYCLEVAVTNSWLAYKRDCVLLGTHQELKSSKEFRLHVSDGLRASLLRGRGRPSLDNSLQKKVIRSPWVPRPSDPLRTDEANHWPVKCTKGRCRYCSSTVRIKCTKCDTRLCITQDRNCFLQFHITKSGKLPVNKTFDSLEEEMEEEVDDCEEQEEIEDCEGNDDCDEDVTR